MSKFLEELDEELVNYFQKGRNTGMLTKIFSMIFCVSTAMIGHTIHGSLFWSIVDFFFSPIAWIKWIVCHEVTLTVIKQTFSWFFQ